MSRRAWLASLVLVGIAIFALGFVDGWIVHEREVRGEGFRFVKVVLGVWEERGFPVLAAGVVLALLVALAAAMAWTGIARVPEWVLLISAGLVLGILLAGAWPVAQDGHASSIDLSAGWPLGVAIVLGVVLAVSAGMVAQPSWRLVVLTGVVMLGAVATSAGLRWYGLQLAEGDGRHWSDGSYTRVATGGEPTETMTIQGDSVTIGDRWSGSWEWSGWVVTIDHDPACPGSRGTYHAHGEGEEDLTFVKVVDTCEDGARAADLETGIWERDP